MTIWNLFATKGVVVGLPIKESLRQAGRYREAGESDFAAHGNTEVVMCKGSQTQENAYCLLTDIVATSATSAVHVAPQGFEHHPLDGDLGAAKSLMGKDTGLVIAGAGDNKAEERPRPDIWWRRRWWLLSLAVAVISCCRCRCRCRCRMLVNFAFSLAGQAKWMVAVSKGPESYSHSESNSKPRLMTD
jgi:hypothetical protein